MDGMRQKAIFKNYVIQEGGRVLSKRRRYVLESYLKPVIKQGYWAVKMRVDRKQKWETIHRLLSKAFIPNPDNLPFVNHKDGNKLNNELSNLEWCTHQENMRHASVTGLLVTKEGNKKVVFNDSDIRLIREYAKQGRKHRVIGEDFGTTQDHIWRIVNRKIWAHIC